MYSAPIMLLVDTSFLLDHARLRHAVSDIYEKGFDTICLEFRNCLYTEYDPQGKAAMKIVAEETQRLGIQFVKIMPMIGPNVVKQFPESRQVWTVEHRGHISNKLFSVTIKSLNNAGFVSTEPSIRGIAKAFHVTRENGRIVQAVDITAKITYSIEINSSFIFKGTYEQDGEILIYPAYHTDYMDFASKDINRSVDEFMEQYTDLPLSGYAIDEFGAGNRVCDAYFISECFQSNFREKYGYELLDKLYLLKNEAIDECAGKTRYAFYQLTMDHTYQIQKHVKDRYTELYGKDLFGGFHSTWWGEGNSGDVWSGNIDYFRLTENLSGGFVDAQFDAERTMTSMTMLAESLAKFSDSGIAYNMCWDRNTTQGKLDYYQRLLAVRNVRWVGHAYGSAGPYGPGYPDHITWKDTKLSLHRQKTLQAFIGNAVSQPKVAMMYVWESVACFNNDNMHYHKLSMKALLDKMLLRNIEIDIIPTYDNNLSRFDTLIVLWPAMLPEATWKEIKEYAASGKKIIFIGPPAQYTVEGRDISGEFAELTGAAVGDLFSSNSYEGEYEYIAWDMWFTTNKIPMQCYPMQSVDSDTQLSHEGDILGVQKSNVEYYSFEMPLTHYFNTILSELEQYCEVRLPDGIISKVSHDGDISVITLTGHWGSKINAAFQYKGNQLTITNGNLVGIKLRADTIIEIISEKDCRIELNGLTNDYVII
ncbi:hypothetical protein EHS13_08965 [Paenibacillus psychroresistens]|uniref:Beta-galactosidase trimerisation domain-containing protein n=1 Tax=Paenibacillus psychroresistens TaxID=1778678 RepID=A0A6B8RHD2_9BACL|nr:hypothetical protein [Paenibacillus psychroresistens]QGQ95005.1 hypothetical protein EHS13_08965 [Paenibacillus psychroresistens]